MATCTVTRLRTRILEGDHAIKKETAGIVDSVRISDFADRARCYDLIGLGCDGGCAHWHGPKSREAVVFASGFGKWRT
jgi:hypothetical protein